MIQERPAGVENIWEEEIRGKISDVLKLIRNDRDYNPKDIDEEKITSALMEKFHHLPKNDSSSSSNEIFLATIEGKIKIMIAKKAEARIREKISKTAEEAHKIGEKIHGKDINKPGIPQAA